MEDNSPKAAAVIEVVITAFFIFSTFYHFKLSEEERVRAPAKRTASVLDIETKSTGDMSGLLGKSRLFFKKNQELEKPW